MYIGTGGQSRPRCLEFSWSLPDLFHFFIASMNLDLCKVLDSSATMVGLSVLGFLCIRYISRISEGFKSMSSFFDNVRRDE